MKRFAYSGIVYGKSFSINASPVFSPDFKFYATIESFGPDSPGDETVPNELDICISHIDDQPRSDACVFWKRLGALPVASPLLSWQSTESLIVETPGRKSSQKILRRENGKRRFSSASSKNWSGYNSGWRLPTENPDDSNIDELESILLAKQPDCPTTGPCIDATAFPNTPVGYFWLSSSSAGYQYAAWAVDFGNGYVSSYGKRSPLHVRPVRGGP